MPASGHSYLRDLGSDVEESDVSPMDFESVFRRYASYVSTILFRTLGDRSDVEDLVQDVFIDAFKGIDNLEEPEALKGWLAVIAVRRARRHIRKKKVKSFIGLDDLAVAPELIETGASPEHEALIQQVYENLQRLSANDRLAWTLRHVHGMTLKEVSAACECSMSTTKRRVARAEEKLQKAMEHD